MKEVTMRLAGTAGEGLLTAGDILSRTFFRLGLSTFNCSTYEAEVRGERPSSTQIRVSNGPLLSQGDELDILVAFGSRDVGLHKGDLREGGTLIYDPRPVDPFGDISAFTPEEIGKVTAVPLPTMEMAYRELKKPLTRNIAIIGALASLFRVERNLVRGVIEERLMGGGRMDAASNIEALEAGYRYGEEHLGDVSFPPLPKGRKKKATRLLLSGNEALSLGAIASGAAFFSGYPITPASDIMEFMAKNLPPLGGVCMQMEDEMASLGAVIGAAFGGRRAFTATSGPGLSLMAELIGYASMAEIPVVIVDVQRGGPSTGMPTRTEQSDLLFSIFGSHGEAPKVVVAPSGVADAFGTIKDAFSIAWEHRVPVILLMDQFLSQRREVVEGIEVRAVPADGAPLAGAGVTLTGLEHRGDGTPACDPALHRENMERRFRRLEGVLNGFEAVRRYGRSEGEVGIVTWGSSVGAVREACEGMDDVGICEVRLLNPLPGEAVEEFARGFKKLCVVEANHTGQVAGLLEGRLLREVKRITKCEGTPFTVREVIDAANLL
ncbi:MAG: 2-oxoacid:acceptor oxidoreductase family protein [Thermodesulfobacteriota bacterium]